MALIEPYLTDAEEALHVSMRGLREERLRLEEVTVKLEGRARRVREAMMRVRALEGQLQLIDYIESKKYRAPRSSPPPEDLRRWVGPIQWRESQAAMVGRFASVAAKVADGVRVGSSFHNAYWGMLKGLLELVRVAA